MRAFPSSCLPHLCVNRIEGERRLDRLFDERVAMLEGVVSHLLQRVFHFFQATDSLALVVL